MGAATWHMPAYVPGSHIHVMPSCPCAKLSAVHSVCGGAYSAIMSAVITACELAEYAKYATGTQFEVHAFCHTKKSMV